MENSAPAKLSKAAVAGLVLSLAGLAFFPFSFFGLVLGAVGIAKTREGRLRGRGLALLALVLAPFTVFSSWLELQHIAGSGTDMKVGLMAVEPRVNLPLLARAIEAEQRKTGKLPAALALTPAKVPCGTDPVPWPPDAPAGWAALGFSPSAPVRYAYEYAPDPDGKSFSVRAHGDLNCDGKTSLYEGRPGQLTLHVENELE